MRASTTIIKNAPGISAISVSAVANGKFAAEFVTLTVLDETRLEILNVTVPRTIRYGDERTLAFLVRRESMSVPKSVRATVTHPRFSHTWDATDPSVNQEFTLRFFGNNLKPGENTLAITVEYEDAFGVLHVESADVPIALIELSLVDRIDLWLTMFSERFGG